MGTSTVSARKDFKPLSILHIEDDDNDALLLAKACERAKLPVTIHRVKDGELAKAYLLERAHTGAVNPLPQIVILDLKMPTMDGFEFLKWIRTEPALALVPVLVFTASIATEDKNRAMSAGASSYFVKPASFEALVRLVQHFQVPGADN